MPNPYLAKDADVGCRHMCMVKPSKKDDAQMMQFLSTTKYKGLMVPDHHFPFTHAEMLAKVK